MPIAIDDSTIKTVWENNPDTSLTATNLSKSGDVIASYLDFDSAMHEDGKTFISLDTENGNGFWLRIKKGTIVSLVNTETIDGTDTGIKILSENDHYRMFDVGLEDIWITTNDMDSNPSNPTDGSWGSNKEWFVYMCDKMDDAIDKENKDDYGGGGQILVSQGRKFPIGQIPGQVLTTRINYSQRSTRKIGGFKTDVGGKIIFTSVWDISQKYNQIRAKEYYILNEYDEVSTDYNRHTNRLLRLSDLDSFSVPTPVYNNLTVSSSAAATPVIKADVINNLFTATNVAVSGNISISGSIRNDTGISGTQYRIAESSALNSLEIATANGSQPIYVRQYSSGFESINQSVTLLSATGNSVFPGSITAQSIIATGSTATICGVPFHADSVAPTGATRINCEGYFYATRVYNAVWNDLAEFFLTSDIKEYGKVYVVDEKGLVTRSTHRADGKVIGVASDTAGYLLKQEYEHKGIPIGLAGSVNVWVKTKVAIGQELVSDKNGFAVAANWFEKIFKRDAIIGKAIGFSKDDVNKRILMLVK